MFNRKNNEEDFAYIAKLCTEKCVEKIVIGMPYNMDGSEGFRAQKTYDFAEKLRGYIGDIPIVFEDERLTTVEAEKLLIQSGVRRENRKKVIDKVAAAIILQNYLDRQN
ncbi:MAG: Holliday junction resolvase RuvX [Firmicutes bacterium]|nr:Holliday junction resolvase RuvX [Bacillota bacterium]